MELGAVRDQRRAAGLVPEAQCQGAHQKLLEQGHARLGCQAEGVDGQTAVSGVERELRAGRTTRGIGEQIAEAVIWLGLARAQ